ncbi:MAG TPA: methyltransferase domain-containing protein [Ignavibacteriales bacterium]|nr:methyltransferase domain-containing protein [Ignavibacteriales bacterium]
MNNSNTLSKQARWMRLGMQANLFPAYKRFRRKVMELSGISPASSVLDFGCGVGLFEEYIKKNMELCEGKITGVDTGKELIEIAKSSFQDTRNYEFFLIDESGRLPFPDNSFDIILSSFVLHLLTRPQKADVLKEFMRVLKPDGHMLLAEIGKPKTVLGHWIKFLTLHLWIKIWPYEVNSVDSFNGLLPDFIHSAGFTKVETVLRMKGYIDFISAAKGL